MFRKIVQEFEAPKSFWLNLAGCSDLMLDEYLTGQRSIPRSLAKRLSRATGIPPEEFLAKRETEVPFQLPTLWMRARKAGLGQRTADLTAISHARLLAENYWDVLQILGKTLENETLDLFTRLQTSASRANSPEEQGRLAAEAFLSLTGLNQQRVGIGEVLRGHLRSKGVFILEAPLGRKSPEGFCLEVGEPDARRVCIFANTYSTTWFHRNFVLLHELCHGAFDLQETVEFDAKIPNDADSTGANAHEVRANSFAMNSLVSKELLLAYSNRGFDLRTLETDGLARLMAEIHAEPHLIIRAAESYGLIDGETAAILRARFPLDSARKAASYHAKKFDDLSVEERSRFIKNHEAMERWPRTTNFPIRGMRLPIPFVNDVLDALESSKISSGRARELLLTKDLSRFGVSSDTA